MDGGNEHDGFWPVIQHNNVKGGTHENHHIYYNGLCSMDIYKTRQKAVEKAGIELIKLTLINE